MTIEIKLNADEIEDAIRLYLSGRMDEHVMEGSYVEWDFNQYGQLTVTLTETE